MAYKEAEFHSYFKENWGDVLPGCIMNAHEYSLYPAFDVLKKHLMPDEQITSKNFGRIDFIFEYKKTRYVAEVKYYPFSSGEFWDAMKVVGYTSYYKFQTGQKDRVKPAIIMPIKSVSLEHQYVAADLGITIFAIEEYRGGFKMKKLEKKPYWYMTNELSEKDHKVKFRRNKKTDINRFFTFD